MEALLGVLRGLGTGAAVLVVTGLCLAGVALSCLSVSGTWLVVVGTALTAVLRRGAFPGVWTVVVFVLLSALVEVAEALSGTWGVVRKGGSKAGGVAALVGGLAGGLVGTFLPPPLVGSVVGMLAGGFLLVYVVERRRLRVHGKAADIAWGAVVSRVLVTGLKVMVTMGMAGVLLVGVLVS